jgi:hypothetical protein
MYVTKHVQVTLRAYATRHVAIARLALRATDAADTLEAGRVTRTTSRAR